MFVITDTHDNIMDRRQIHEDNDKAVVLNTEDWSTSLLYHYESNAPLWKGNVERCDKILECKRQISYWTSLLEELEIEQDRVTKIARLKLHPKRTWKTLSRKEKLDKEYILAAMESCGGGGNDGTSSNSSSNNDVQLPSILRDFPNSAFPSHIRTDRDILLARVKRPDFQDYINENRGNGSSDEDDDDDDGNNDRNNGNCGAHRLYIPQPLRNDKEVIMTIITKGKHPHVIECMSENLRDDEDILDAILSLRDKNNNITPLPDHFLQHFSARIRSNPSIMLKVVGQHLFGIPSLQYVSQSLRNDKEFIMKVIKEYSLINVSKNNCIKYTEITTKGCNEKDTDTVTTTDSSTATGATTGSSSAYSSTCYGNLDKFLLILKYVSPRLRDDYDVVFAAVSLLSGVNLKHASYPLRRDRAIVVAACTTSATATTSSSQQQKCGICHDGDGVHAFRYCLPGPLKDELLQDRQFVMDVLLKSESSSNWAAPSSSRSPLSTSASLRGSLLETYKTDKQFIMKALEVGGHIVDFNDIPSQLQHDVEFIQEAIGSSSNLAFYLDLPEEIKNDYNIALQVLLKILEADDSNDNLDDDDDGGRSYSSCSDSDPDDTKTDTLLHHEYNDIILEITNRVPALLGNHRAMLSLTKNRNYKDILQETLQFSPIEIRSDKRIMLQAVKNNADALDYCDEDTLQNDYDILMAAIASSPSSLYLVSDSFQFDHPEIVVKAIEGTAAIDPTDLWSLYDDINEDLWYSNRDVAVAWLRCGGEWLDDDFPEEYCDDEELMLIVAEYNWTEFVCASDSLKASREFMLKAAAKDGRVFNEVCDTLRHDYDLALVAFSNCCQALEGFVSDDDEEDFEFMVSIAKRVRHSLAEYDVFLTQILCAIECKRPCDRSQCCLSMLNQGYETSSGYKQLIASFLGVPDATGIDRLRMVSKNLLHWGF